MSTEVGVERPAASLALSPPSRPAPGGHRRHVHFIESQVTSTHPVAGEAVAPSRKVRCDPLLRSKRKRSYSSSASYSGDNSGRWFKRRRSFVLHSKFLLGGTITDPLNLGALAQQDGSESDESKKTVKRQSKENAPKRSISVPVLIPANINDPLNLDAASDTEALDACFPMRRRRKTKKRKRRLSEPGGSKGLAVESERAFIESLKNSSHKRRRSSGSNQAASCSRSTNRQSASKCPDAVFRDGTAVPDAAGAAAAATENLEESSGSTTQNLCSVPPVHQLSPSRVGGNPGTSSKGTKLHSQPTPDIHGRSSNKRRSRDDKIVSPVIPQSSCERKRHHPHPPRCQLAVQSPCVFNPKREQFQYGNYTQYYGYRNPVQTQDPRLAYLKKGWFEGRSVLDVGCNIGHITLTVARDFVPKSIVGVDIDKKLVNIAKKNIKHYMHQGSADEGKFPKSIRLLYGPLHPPLRVDGSPTFPYNVAFVQGNYVPENDELLEAVREEYDVILCLSVTKWVHLNWGDVGLKRMFRRMFLSLHPGGKLILEPQPWPSYNRKRKLTAQIYENYKNIRLLPRMFEEHLVNEVGFTTCERLPTPQHASRGFQRPIFVCTKAVSSDATEVPPAGERISNPTRLISDCPATTFDESTVVAADTNVVVERVLLPECTKPAVEGAGPAAVDAPLLSQLEVSTPNAERVTLYSAPVVSAVATERFEGPDATTTDTLSSPMESEPTTENDRILNTYTSSTIADTSANVHATLNASRETVIVVNPEIHKDVSSLCHLKAMQEQSVREENK